MLVNLTVNRKGGFMCYPIPAPKRSGSRQCGFVDEVHYEYRVSISASSEKLNPKGYVIAGEDIEAYFRSSYEGKKTALSCEGMASLAIAALHRRVRMGGVTPTRIWVRIYGTPVSFIEGEWKA